MQQKENNSQEPARDSHWKTRLHEVIYESNTAAGKAFDIALLIAIVTSIIVVMLDSVDAYKAKYGQLFYILEWIFTILFTLEYILRLICINKPMHYVKSPLGIIDLLALIPSYLGFIFTGTASLLVFRALRLLRVFRIFKLAHFLTEMRFLSTAIRGSLRKISIFMFTVLTLAIILGSIMYIIEGGKDGFNSIPESVYWAIVTITTVGYGDISPTTPLGRLVASLVMLLGYAIIAVPTGIITTELVLASRQKGENPESCPNCGREGHDANAVFCKYCGNML